MCCKVIKTHKEINASASIPCWVNFFGLVNFVLDFRSINFIIDLKKINDIIKVLRRVKCSFIEPNY